MMLKQLDSHMQKKKKNQSTQPHPSWILTQIGSQI